MRKGFVFGKFHPFHLGHAALIDFAAAHADEVTVIVCAAKSEPIDGERRAAWIRKHFALNPFIKVLLLPYSDEELPNTSKASEDASAKWAGVFKRLVPDADVVFTSEPYGEMVARYMNILHIPFDPERNYFPVSATDVRGFPDKYWKFLPPQVKKDVCFKTLLIGTESTGKTTLANHLADELNLTLVKEAARDIVKDSNQLEWTQLEEIGIAQGEAILKATVGDSPGIVIDTGWISVRAYALHFFKRDILPPPLLQDVHNCQLNLYLPADVPFVQDGTRLNEKDRNDLDITMRTLAWQLDRNPIELTGSWENKKQRSVELFREGQKKWFADFTW